MYISLLSERGLERKSVAYKHLVPSGTKNFALAIKRHFSAWSSDDESSSMIHSTIESGRLPFLIRSS